MTVASRSSSPSPSEAARSRAPPHRSRGPQGSRRRQAHQVAKRRRNPRYGSSPSPRDRSRPRPRDLCAARHSRPLTAVTTSASPIHTSNARRQLSAGRTRGPDPGTRRRAQHTPRRLVPLRRPARRPEELDAGARSSEPLELVLQSRIGAFRWLESGSTLLGQNLSLCRFVTSCWCDTRNAAKRACDRFLGRALAAIVA